MSEFRRDDTASWDAQEVRQAQGAAESRHPLTTAKAVTAGGDGIRWRCWSVT